MRREAAPALSARERYEAGNRVAAGIILADPARHGGEGALAVMWARLWTANNAEAGAFRLRADGERE
jgi:hypothetical protein